MYRWLEPIQSKSCFLFNVADCTYNFESTKESTLPVLVGIAPGNGSKELKSLDPYLDILVDELLNKKLYDPYQNAPFILKLQVFMFVLDYPGIGNVFNVMGSGAHQGCLWCEEKGKSGLLKHVMY